MKIPTSSTNEHGTHNICNHKNQTVSKGVLILTASSYVKYRLNKEQRKGGNIQVAWNSTCNKQVR